jgi:acyl CoA:acetate/3-ketoacid CoA transferase
LFVQFDWFHRLVVCVVAVGCFGGVAEGRGEGGLVGAANASVKNDTSSSFGIFAGSLLALVLVGAATVLDESESGSLGFTWVADKEGAKSGGELSLVVSMLPLLVMSVGWLISSMGESIE